MISKDKQYRTRDGREVRIYATDGGHSAPIHGAIKTECGWEHYGWRPNGKGILEQSDLIEIKPRIQREYWVNVYPGRVSSLWETKEEAERVANKHKCIACVKVVIDCEEGEGL